jgi:Ca2+/Na+ antiporter
MELDDFKANWNTSQQAAINQQKLSTDKLDKLMTHSTTALQEIQKRNNYWYKLGMPIFSALIIILLVEMVIFYFVPGKDNVFREMLLPVSIMLVFAVVSMWIYKRHQQIFDVDVSENLRETLRKTVTDFKRFYILYILVYSVLFPAYFYALITFFTGMMRRAGAHDTFIRNTTESLSLSIPHMIALCISLTIVALLINHWYYRVKYFKYIKILQLNLKELDA